MALTLVLSAMPINVLAESQSSDDDNPDEELIQKADKYVTLEDGAFSITDEEELRDILTSDEFETVENLIQEANSNLEDVDLSSDNVEVNNDTVIVSPENESSNNVSTLAAKEGKRDIEFHWASVDIWLTKTDVNAILKGGVTGGATYLGGLFGGVGAIAGAISSTVVNEYVNAQAVHINHNYITGMTTTSAQ